MPQNFQSLGPSEASTQAGLWAELRLGGEAKLELRSLTAGAVHSGPICGLVSLGARPWLKRRFWKASPQPLSLILSSLRALESPGRHTSEHCDQTKRDLTTAMHLSLLPDFERKHCEQPPHMPPVGTSQTKLSFFNLPFFFKDILSQQ